MNLSPFTRVFFIITSSLFFYTCDSPEPTMPPLVEETKQDTLPRMDAGIKETVYSPERNVWQRPNLIISLLGNGNLSEKVVVDIGAGTGFFSIRLAPLAKKVIAMDIDQDFLDIIDSTRINTLPAKVQSRLETRLTPMDEPNLETDEVDAVLIVNTFMYIDNKLVYLQKLKQALKPGGRIVVVDFKRKRTGLGPLPREHRLPLYMIEDLFYEAGYKNIEAIDTELEYQYILVADN